MAVIPSSLQMSRSSPRTRTEVAGSRLATGSSARMIAGCCANARAMPTRCCWPPDVYKRQQAGWKKIIGDKPTLIMLDELPPYLENASTTVIGGGTLATVSTYTLSCLMSAALELPRCCIVIANLSGSYVAQTKAIAEAISNLQQEASRCV